MKQPRMTGFRELERQRLALCSREGILRMIIRGTSAISPFHANVIIFLPGTGKKDGVAEARVYVTSALNRNERDNERVKLGSPAHIDDTWSSTGFRTLEIEEGVDGRCEGAG